MGARISSVIVAAILLAAAPRASLAAEPRIVVLTPAKDDPVSLRIQAELRALRFEVPDVVVAPEPPSRERLEEVARSGEAVAAVRVAPSSAGVEVWIVDRMTGKTVLREIVSDDLRSPGGVATVALRVVELLRASLMELDAPRPPRGEVATPAQVRELLAPPPAAPPPPPIVSVEVGPAAIFSPGGLSPAGDVSAALHLRPAGGPGASLLFLLPVLPSRAGGPEGSTAARVSMAGAAFRWVFSSPRSAWAPSVGAGLAAVWLHFDGTPASHYAAPGADLFSVAPFARAGVGVAALPRLRLRGDVLAGVSLPRAAIAFGDRIAAVWGRPFVAPTLGVELSWP